MGTIQLLHAEGLDFLRAAERIAMFEPRHRTEGPFGGKHLLVDGERCIDLRVDGEHVDDQVDWSSPVDGEQVDDQVDWSCACRRGARPRHAARASACQRRGTRPSLRDPN
jgi:hypothetical protein